jgi:hypothetical protein
MHWPLRSWALSIKVKRDILLFSELINFMTKIIPEKSRIAFYAVKNTPEPLKIWGKFSKTLWNMRNPNKVFETHYMVILEHLKLDYAHRQVEISYRKSRKNS